MDPIVTVALLGLVGTVTAALLVWHASVSNQSRMSRNVGLEAAERGLSEARKATEAERREYERLRDERLREFADQLGNARIDLANCQLECAALRDQLGQRQHGGLS